MLLSGRKGVSEDGDPEKQHSFSLDIYIPTSWFLHRLDYIVRQNCKRSQIYGYDGRMGELGPYMSKEKGGMKKPS